MVAHSSLTDTAVLVMTSMPSTAPDFVNQKAVVALSGRYIELISRGTSSVSDWAVTAGTIRRGAGNPTALTPDYVGQQYQNTDDGTLWIGDSLVAGDWQVTASPSSPGGGSAIKQAHIVDNSNTTSDLIGDGFTFADYNVRLLNAEYSNSFGTPVLITSGANAGRISLPEPGTYRLEAGAAAYAPSGFTQQFFIQLWDRTNDDPVNPAAGGLVRISENQQAMAYCSGYLTVVTAPVVLELRQFCSNATSFGNGSGIRPSIFNVISAFIDVMKIG